MLILEDPVNFTKQYSIVVDISHKEKSNKDFLTRNDLIKFYEAKANIFAGKWDKTKDYRSLIKSINAIIIYEELSLERKY